MKMSHSGWVLSAVLGTVLLSVACGPTAEPTATTAPAEPTATTAPARPTATTAPARPTATTAPGQPTATTAPGQPTATTGAAMDEVKLRPVPVLDLPAPNPEAQHGGVFRLLNWSDPSSFHGWEDCCGYGNEIFTDKLVKHNIFEPNRGDQILPSLAYDWWTDETGEVYTFKLRDGVTFHDGEAFTCDDAKFTLDTMRLGQDAKGSELVASAKGPLLSRVQATRCVDSHTLEVETEGPMPSLIPTLSLANFGIYPQHWLEGNQARARDTQPPGVGPFRFNEYVVTESLSYTRNSNYWHQPYPYLDELRSQNVGSVSAAHAGFRVGRGEFIGAGHILPLPKSQEDEMIAAGRLVRDPPRVQHADASLQVNWTREPWSDPRFAQAVRCAVDSREIIDTAWDGRHFEDPIFPLASDPDGTEWGVTKEEWKAVGPCHGPTAETNMEQRRQIARELLAEMGFGPGNPPVIEANYGSVYVGTFEITQQHLAAVGIELAGTVQDRTNNYAKNFAGEFDITIAPFQTYRYDPDQLLYEQYYSTADRNYGKYTNAEVDALIDLQSKTLDPEERQRLVKQINRTLLEDNAKIMLFAFGFSHYYPPWVKGWYIYTANVAAYSALWIDKGVYDRLGG